MPQILKNNVSGVLGLALSASSTSMTLLDASSFPTPAGGDFYLLTLVGLNTNGQEASWEIVKVTAKVSNTLTIVRAQEGTTAAAWPMATTVQLRLTAGSVVTPTGNAATATKLATARTINGVSFDGSANITLNAVDSTAREPAVTAGTTAQYWRGDKTWRDFSTDVRAATLFGLSTATNAVIAATDTVLGALGKLQKQVSDNLATLTSHTGSTSNPHSVTKSQVGLGNVDNTSDATKAVLSATKLATARTIAGTSFDGQANIDIKYTNLTSKPTLGTAAAKDVPATGNADNAQVVMGSDTRLSNARTPTAHSHGVSDVTGLQAALNAKQDTLVSGTSIKMINGESLLGGGNILLLAPPGMVGKAGSQGFGVGEYPGTLPPGFSTMEGTGDKASANYGNYQYTDGSVMVFVPKFYYRIGHASSPRYATYGANAIDIAGIEAFADEAAANAAGYALHRAFKDGGAVKSGFFIDKYLASKNGTTSCKSVQNGVPISLATSAGYTASNGMTGCTGILADSVVLARARGAGVFNVASIFMYDALAKLSLAHGQAATGTANCAWYDPTGTTNFPKGCNNNALADTNDATVTFTTAGDTANANKPKTGSASNLAKTTHNGQPCGVTDVNGAMWQAMLGITQAGTSATDTTTITTGNAYVLKSSVALASLTGSFGGATDAWGTTSSLTTNYDLINGFLPWTSATGWEYFGNGSNQVFSGATSGTDYLRSCCGIANATGMSAAGTNQFGADGNYRYGRANLFPVASGDWDNAANAGVFCRNWYYFRSNDNRYAGFRCAAYGN